MKTGLKKLMRTSVVSLVTLPLMSCQPYEGSSGEITLTTRSEAVLLDAPGRSCMGRFESSADLQPLHMSLGRVSMTWAPPTSSSSLEIIYLRVTMRSAGLSGDVIKTIAADELNCIFGDSSTALPVLSSSITSKTFAVDLKLGSLGASDATKSNSFSGNGEVLMYALVTDGDTQTPYTGRSSFRFTFDGIR